MSYANADAVLTTSAAPIIGTGLGPSALILKGSVCNTDTISHTVSVYRVPLGGSASASNIIIDAEPIAAGQTVVLPISGQTLYQQQTLQAAASVNALVNLNLSYSAQSA